MTDEPTRDEVAKLLEQCEKTNANWGALRDIAPFLARQYISGPLGAEAMKRAAAEMIRPKRPRPCDCDQCDCGNPGDLRDVVVWDVCKLAADDILALPSPADLLAAALALPEVRALVEAAEVLLAVDEKTSGSAPGRFYADLTDALAALRANIAQPERAAEIAWEALGNE